MSQRVAYRKLPLWPCQARGAENANGGDKCRKCKRNACVRVWMFVGVGGMVTVSACCWHGHIRVCVDVQMNTQTTQMGLRGVRVRESMPIGTQAPIFNTRGHGQNALQSHGCSNRDLTLRRTHPSCTHLSTQHAYLAGRSHPLHQREVQPLLSKSP